MYWSCDNHVQTCDHHVTFLSVLTEVMGALVSVLIIWVLSGVLFYKAVLRVINQNFEVDANIMLITACIKVFVNVLLVNLLATPPQTSHTPSFLFITT